MKRITILLFSIILLPFCLMAQSAKWPVNATTKSGKQMPVNVYLEDGTAYPYSQFTRLATITLWM